MAHHRAKPPKPRSELAALPIVGHDLRVVLMPIAKCLDQVSAARQGVARDPGPSCRTACIDVRKHGARNVAFSVRANPCFRVEQIIPTSDDANQRASFKCRATADGQQHA